MSSNDSSAAGSEADCSGSSGGNRGSVARGRGRGHGRRRLQTPTQYEYRLKRNANEQERVKRVNEKYRELQEELGCVAPRKPTKVQILGEAIAYIDDLQDELAHLRRVSSRRLGKSDLEEELESLDPDPPSRSTSSHASSVLLEPITLNCEEFLNQESGSSGSDSPLEFTQFVSSPQTQAYVPHSFTYSPQLSMTYFSGADPSLPLPTTPPPTLTPTPPFSADTQFRYPSSLPSVLGVQGVLDMSSPAGLVSCLEISSVAGCVSPPEIQSTSSPRYPVQCFPPSPADFQTVSSSDILPPISSTSSLPHDHSSHPDSAQAIDYPFSLEASAGPQPWTPSPSPPTLSHYYPCPRVLRESRSQPWYC